MKKQALFEICLGVVGLILWVMYALGGIELLFWVVVPMVLVGFVGILFWYNRKEFAVPEDFKPAFKKNNIIALVLALVIAVIAYLSINPSVVVNGWNLWVYFVVYAFSFCHGAGLFVAYNKYLKKK